MSPILQSLQPFISAISNPLILILAAPIIGAIILLLFIRDDQRQEARTVAIVATAICLLLSIYVFMDMNQVSNLTKAGEKAASGLSYFIDETNLPWVPALGINFHVGVDGVTAPMVLLTGLAAFCGVLISWRIEDRTREFFAFFLLLVAGVYGVFISLDMFLLFFWYELSIFPMYLLIATWGWAAAREYAAMKLTLYILIGSVLALVGLLVMYFVAGQFFSDPNNLVLLRQALNNPSAPAYSFDFSHFEVASRWLQVAHTARPFDISALGFCGISIAQLWFPVVFIGF